MQYAKVLVDAPTARGSFLYAIPPVLLADIRRGSFVSVPIRQREVDGIVIDISARLPKGLMQNQIRPIRRIVAGRSILPAALYDLAAWMAHYYLCSLADAVFMMLPPFPQKQQIDADTIKETQAKRKNQYYVNGRELGRWDKYQSAIERSVASGKQAIALFPSTAQAKRFAAKIGSIIPKTILYSADLPRAKRFRAWSQIASGAVDCVVGTRLAAFVPLPLLGLIVIDDETHPGHQNPQQPRYHAKEIAFARARLSGAALLCGGELPSLATFAQIRKNTIKELNLPNTALPTNLIDTQAQKNLLSLTVENALRTYHRGIIVTTKLGQGAATRCQDCRHLFCCPSCEMPLTQHAGHILRCHHCGRTEPFPLSCPACHGSRFWPAGAGTERLEEYLTNRFPRSRIERLEAGRPLSDGWDMLVATVKLLDTTVTAPVIAVASLDTILELPDPSAVERAAQIIVQLRSRAVNRYLIQTRLPNHPVFNVLEQPEEFLVGELGKRQSMRYPPAITLVRLLMVGSSQAKIASRLSKLAKVLKDNLSPQFVSVLGPGPAFYEKIKGLYRYHLLLKLLSDDKKTRQKLKTLIPSDIQIDVNPISIL